MDKETQSNVRLTQIQNKATTSQILKVVFSICFRTFGNQFTQLQKFHQKFVRDQNWLSESQFKQIVNLCHALPGPTIVQVIITIAMLKTKTVMTGFWAFIIFNIPSWIVLSLLGWLAGAYITPNSVIPTQITLLFLGFNASGAGIMTQSFIKNFKDNYQSPAKLIIMIFSALIFLVYRSIKSITFCLVVGAIISLYMEIDTKKKMSHKSESLFRNSGLTIKFARVSLFILIGLYCVLWIFFQINSSSQYIYSFVFYFVGCFIIGPVNTIFSYFYANFLQLQLITEQQFWLGLPIAFLLPGSIVNVGIYFGSIIDGFRGIILSGFFIYLPCFLSLYGILPQWRYYRDKPGIQRLFNGLTCVTTGLIFSTIILCLQHCIKVDISLSICIFIVSVFLSQIWNFDSFLIILLCGLLANTRRWGLIYYRMLPDHPY